MKFTNNIKFCFALFFIYLTVFSEINAFQNGLSLRNHRSKALAKYSNHRKFPFKNPMGNFVSGLAEDLANGDKGFLECFPAAWKTGNESTTPAAAEVSNNMGSWGGAIESFFSMAQPVIDFFCKYRLKVINFLSGSFIKRKLRKYRLLLQNGNNRAANLYKRRWGLSSVKNAIKGAAHAAESAAVGAAHAAGSAVVGAVNAAGKFVRENIVEPVFNNFINPIKEKLMSLFNKARDFFSSKDGIISKVKNCIEKVKNAAKEIMVVVNGLKAKFQTLMKTISLSQFAVIIFVIDFVVALICDYKTFKKGMTDFMAGIRASDKNEKFYRLGKGLGTFLRAFATAKTFTETLLGKLPFRKY